MQVPPNLYFVCGNENQIILCIVVTDLILNKHCSFFFSSSLHYGLFMNYVAAHHVVHDYESHFSLH